MVVAPWMGGACDGHAAGEDAHGDDTRRIAGELNAAAHGVQAGGAAHAHKPARRA
jgi:hypothetical protein